MRAPHRTHRPDGEATEGHVGYGRPGTARVTGSRAIVSPRLVVAPSRGGHHAPAVGSHPARTSPKAKPQQAGTPAPATRPVYRLLLMKGLTPTEAANLTAFICGLSTSDPRWSLKQVNQLLFLRAMRQAGRFGDTDGAKKRTH